MKKPFNAMQPVSFFSSSVISNNIIDNTPAPRPRGIWSAFRVELQSIILGFLLGLCVALVFDGLHLLERILD